MPYGKKMGRNSNRTGANTVQTGIVRKSPNSKGGGRKKK